MNSDSPLSHSGSQSASQSNENSVRTLLPNLGAEEGQDWNAVANQPLALVAARLWALLFAGQDRFRLPLSNAEYFETRCADFWPEALGSVPDTAAFPWQEKAGAHAWLNTETAMTYAEQTFGVSLAGLSPEKTQEFSDKARCIQAADSLGLTPRPLASLITEISSEECAAPESLLPRLENLVAAWPAWTEQRFTLKPRWGTSGRGRAGGVGARSVDSPALRGALPRFTKEGGAILEPWLKRETDLSVSLRVPGAEAKEKLPIILGSLEMLTTPSGGYRGHCGEVDNRGRVFSAHREDETLRGEAAMLAGEMQRAGFAGPCGVDAFTYWEEERLRLRSAVEFNPRVTMGIVTLGLIRRALPFVRDRLDLSPGRRRGVLMTTFGEGDVDQREAILARLGDQALAFDLTSPSQSPQTSQRKIASDSAQPQSNPTLAKLLAKAEPFAPTLFFSPDLESLRLAYREVSGC